MSLFWSRTAKRALLVSLTLAAIGYVLGQAFLLAVRVQANIAPTPENEAVLWKTPVTMGLLGLIMTVGVEAFAELFRKPAKQTIKNPPAN